jgi:hypothetical protein
MEHNYVRECEFCTRMFAAGAARASGLIDRRKSQSVSGKRWAERERERLEPGRFGRKRRDTC